MESKGLLQTLTLRGPRASLVWGYRPVATITGWKISRFRDDEKSGWRWTLQGRLSGAVDTFALRQRPLLISAPRRGGFWCWTVRDLHISDATQGIVANLGPPEH